MHKRFNEWYRKEQKQHEIKENVSDCINMVTSNNEGNLIEYEWKTVQDFMLDVDSGNKTAPALNDHVSTLWIYGCSFNENDLQDKGINTIKDFYDWCKKLPKVNEKEYWASERKCVMEAEKRKYENKIYSLVLRKGIKHFLVADKSTNSWLYKCQGYEFRGFINAYGSFENN